MPTGKPGMTKVDINFFGKIGESINVAIEGVPADINLRKLELIIYNQTVAESLHIPVDFPVDETEQDFMADEHWIKARLIYDIDGREVVVESPYYRNPWWPYGGGN